MDVKTIVVGQMGVNCYIVIDEATRVAVVIDPGDDPEDIAEAVRRADADLKHILLTHGHFDHSFAVGELQEAFPGVKLLMHEADVPQLDGDPELTATFFDISRYTEPTFGDFLTDGSVIAFGDTRLTAIHTPGHTPGGLCYLADGVCFTGDTLFSGSIGRSDFPGGSFDALMSSIHQKLLALPDDTVIYPGHGAKSTIGGERAGNPWI